MHRNHRTAFVAFAIVLICLLAVPGLALAKKKKKNSSASFQRFAAPFICGTNQRSTDRIALGTYSTSINILNLSTQDVDLRARVLLSFPPPRPNRGTVSMARAIRLGPGQAIQIDCEELDMVEFPEPPPDTPYTQGFLQIQAAGAIQVWTTQSSGTEAGGIALQTLQVVGEPIARPSSNSYDRVICHVPPGNPDNAHEIAVDPSAVDAHLRHGDYEGYCRDDDFDDFDDD